MPTLDDGKLAELVKGLLVSGGLLDDRIDDKKLWKTFAESPEALTLAHTFVQSVAAKYADILPQLQAVQTQACQVTQEESAALINAPTKKHMVFTPSGGTVDSDTVEIKAAYFPQHTNKPTPSRTNAVSATAPPSLPIPETSPALQEKATTMPSAVPSSQPQAVPPTSLTPGQIPSAAPPAKTPAPVPPQRTTFAVTANAKVNEPFRALVEAKSPTATPVKIQDVQLIPELGLAFDVSTEELHGTPLLAGEHTLKLRYLFDDGQSDPKLLDGECLLIVNHDPWSLWKDIASETQDEYWKPDTDCQLQHGADGCTMLAASKRGRSHAHIGSFRDDDFKLTHDAANGWRVVVVADGAGSAKKSRRGSQLAVGTATDSVMQAFTGTDADKKLSEAIASYMQEPTAGERQIRTVLYDLFGKAAMAAVNAIQAEATSKEYPGKDYSTTILMAIHRHTPTGHFVGAYWVGDGGIGIYRKGHGVHILGKADSGEFAGQTRFLDRTMLESKEIWDRIQFAVVPDFTSLIAMTDGITDPWFETDANLESLKKWDQLWAELEPLLAATEPEKALLNWLDFKIAGNHDDRTIALLCPTLRKVVENGLLETDVNPSADNPTGAGNEVAS